MLQLLLFQAAPRDPFESTSACGDDECTVLHDGGKFDRFCTGRVLFCSLSFDVNDAFTSSSGHLPMLTI